jgi:predicted NBD/HSP70 family sugar kinase
MNLDLKKAGANNIIVKKENRNSIIDLLFQKCGMSKPEIAGTLGLSLPTVSNIVKDLIADGLVREKGMLASSGGRKPIELVPVFDARYAIGVKIENENISLVIIDLGVRIIYQNTLFLPFENTEEYWNSLALHLKFALEDSMIDESKLLGIGIAVPGVVNKNKSVIELAPTLKTKKIPLGKIAGGFSYPVKVENDANLMGFAELYRRDAVSSAICLFINKGIGGAILINNEVFAGKNCSAGEFGHMTIIENGKECSCGKRGCFEAYCSLNVLTNFDERNLDHFFSELKVNHQGYRKVWEEYLEHLATALNNINNIFDSNIILGGELEKYLKDFLEELMERVEEKSALSDNKIHIELSRYGQNACEIGAALLFVEEFLKT